MTRVCSNGKFCRASTPEQPDIEFEPDRNYYTSRLLKTCQTCRRYNAKNKRAARAGLPSIKDIKNPLFDKWLRDLVREVGK